MKQSSATAEKLKELIDTKGYLDVGAGAERELGVSRNKLDQALYILEMEGYLTYKRRIPQVTNPNQKTTLQVLTPPGTEYKDIYDTSKIHSVGDYTISYDNGDTFHKPFEYPTSVSSKRLIINYAEEGGVDKDGVIELRRGVKDLSLGDSHYAQVRIMVDGAYYLKGMVRGRARARPCCVSYDFCFKVLNPGQMIALPEGYYNGNRIMANSRNIGTVTFHLPEKKHSVRKCDAYSRCRPYDSRYGNRKSDKL